MAKNILIVEDDKTVQELYKIALIKDKYNIILAKNVKEAKEFLYKQTIDLIITDIKMPGEHGLILIEDIRKQNKDVPIIICSAYPHFKEDFIVVNSNVTHYFVKPFDIKELVGKIEEILG